MAHALLIDSIVNDPQYDTRERTDAAIAQLERDLLAPFGRPMHESTSRVRIVDHVVAEHRAPVVTDEAIEQAPEIVAAPQTLVPVELPPELLGAMSMFEQLQYTDEASEQMAWGPDGRPAQ